MKKFSAFFAAPAAACMLAIAALAPATEPMPATEIEMIDAVADLTFVQGGDATRLHPEIIWRMLAEREENSTISAAFDRAMEIGSDQARRDLIEVLEDEFILDPETSGLDILGTELSWDHFRAFEWHPNDYPGGAEGPNEALADIMVDALDNVRPERRANRSQHAVVLRSEATDEVWEYILDQWEEIPDTGGRKLNKHAVPAFVAMRKAAKADGVELIIKSAERDPLVAKRNAERAGNPNAVASFSSHSLGLAVDFQMSHRDGEFVLTTSPMQEVVLMRQSRVHKWLHLRGEEFGWYPFQHEPWHWEYNPPGFREIFWSEYPKGAPARETDAGL